jgi:signal transduction histidine kinase
MTRFPKAHSTKPPQADSPEKRGVRRLVVAAFALRALAVPIPLIGFLLSEGQTRHQVRGAGSLLAVATVVAAANAVWAALVRTRTDERFLLKFHFFALDIVLLVFLNLWASSQIPQGSLFHPNADVFWIYNLGTILLWTVLRGSWTGLALTAGGVPLQLAMAQINGPVSLDVTEFASRELWLVVAFIMVRILFWLSSDSLRTADQEGQRAGREAARAQALRDMHDTVLQTLGALARGLQRPDSRSSDTVKWALKVVEDQKTELRALLRAEEEPGAIYDELNRLVIQFGKRTGLQPEFVHYGPVPLISALGQVALLGATSHALKNVELHAHAKRVTVVLSACESRAQVIVRDDGVGFEPNAIRDEAFGIAGSIVARMKDAGGEATIESTPGEGTRIEIWVPTLDCSDETRDIWTRLRARLPRRAERE